MAEFTVKEVTVCSVVIFFEGSVPPNRLLEIYEIFNLTNSSNLNCLNVILIRETSFDDSNFDMKNYCF